MATTCHVILYSRPDCHLCEDVAALLERMARTVPLALTEVNILGDYDLYERYKHRIPVISIVGGPTLYAPIAAGDLERALGIPANSGVTQQS